MKEINLLGNLNSQGGGEQSLCTLASTLAASGWTVHLHPWESVNERYQSLGLPITEGDIKPNLPLLFYANDRIGEFCKEEKYRKIVADASDLIVGINYVNRPLPTCEWLRESGKLRAVIFQNEEKRDEFDRDAGGLLPSTKRIVLFGAVDLGPFLDLPRRERGRGAEDLVVLKHCTADTRKYVTKATRTRGAKIHIWQKHLDKELDTKFYARLLRDVPGARFEFMQAHGELARAFADEPRMRFYAWDEIPVTDFLSHGHVYLYRTSNAWRDQYPRVVAEALAAGLPVLTEPRDGTKDRVQHGDTGLHCIDYDGWCYGLKLLARKERLRRAMGERAREWARERLDLIRWVEVLDAAIST